MRPSLLKRIALALAVSLALVVLLVSMGHSESITSPDSAGDVGQSSSLTIAAGLPFIAYYDATNYDVKAVYCGNEDCTSGNTVTTVAAPSGFAAGQYTSVTVGSDGLPLISYNQSSNLMVAHCDNVACTSSTKHVVESVAGTNGEHNSVTVGADSLPIISYQKGAPEYDLKVAHCNDVACSTATKTTLDSTGTVGAHTSIAVGIDDDLPRIAYYDTTNGDLKLVHCNDAACTGGDETGIAIDSADDVGKFTSVALDGSDQPVISYYDVTNGNLKVMHCNDVSCDGGDESINSPDTAGDVGQFTSLALDDGGNPVVSYYDVTNGNLKVLRCDDPNCAGDESGNITTPDTGGANDVGQYTSLTLDIGYPLISYYDATDRDLEVLHCDDPNCAPAPTPTATPDPSVDADGDGCTAGQETAMGLDDTKWYDFFDVPVPAVPDPGPNGIRNKTISIGDVLAIIFYFATSDEGPVNGSGVDYDAVKGSCPDWDGDTNPDEEGVCYDRSPGPGLPNGVINLTDVLTALQKVGLDCGGVAGPAASGGPNQIEVDADASDPDIDTAAAYGLASPFEVGVNITQATTAYQGYDLLLQYDDSKLTFIPTYDAFPDTVLESWTYSGSFWDGGSAVNAAVTEVGNTLWGGSLQMIAPAAGTNPTGEAVVATFQCIAGGSSNIHLVTSGDNAAVFSTTLLPGGAPITTTLADATVICLTPTPIPTATATPTITPTATNTPTATPAPTPAVMSVDMDPGTDGVQSTGSIDLGTVSGFGDAVSDFRVDIFVEDIPEPGLSSFSFDLLYDDSRIDGIAVVKGPFLASNGADTTCTVQNPDVSPGRARLTCEVTGGTPAQGSGVLGTVEFDILPWPGSDPLSFGLDNTSLATAVGPISHSTQDGSGDIIGVIKLLGGTPGVAGFGGEGGEAQDALLNGPRGSFKVISANALYFADTENNRIRRIYPNEPTGTIVTVAGSDAPPSYCGDGELAIEACLNRPHDVFVDKTGNLYIADTDNHRIRKVNTEGTISTIAGTGIAGYFGDNGPAIAAQINGPRGVAVDELGNVYIADTENHVVRRVDAVSGYITTVAGTGYATGSIDGEGGDPLDDLGDGRQAKDASLNRPHDVYMYATDGGFVIADTENNRIRRVDGLAGVILTFAGSGLADFGGDDGLATLAHLNGPQALAVESDDPRLPSIVVADTQNHRIRRIDGPSARIRTIAGNGTPGWGPYDGSATDAMLNLPAGVAVGSDTVSNTGSGTVEGVDPTTGEPTGRFAGFSCVVGSIATADWILIGLLLGLILARRPIRGLILQVRLLARLAVRPDTTSLRKV